MQKIAARSVVKIREASRCELFLLFFKILSLFGFELDGVIKQQVAPVYGRKYYVLYLFVTYEVGKVGFW